MSNPLNNEQESFDSVKSWIKDEAPQKDFSSNRRTVNDPNLQLGSKKQH